MGCGGCRTKHDQRQATRVRAAMCAACQHGGALGGATVECRVSGRPIAEHVRGGAVCPVGAHPKGGVLTWLGILWYGVPMPIRVALRDKLSGPLPGCGCVKFLKDLYESEVSKWNESALILSRMFSRSSGRSPS